MMVRETGRSKKIVMSPCGPVNRRFASVTVTKRRFPLLWYMVHQMRSTAQ
jgi:hypothetical protein